MWAGAMGTEDIYAPSELVREIFLLTHRLANKLPPTLKAASQKHRAATVGANLFAKGPGRSQQVYRQERRLPDESGQAESCTPSWQSPLCDP
jgi:hypothetical protein